jgi:hypothetical protein
MNRWTDDWWASRLGQFGDVGVVFCYLGLVLVGWRKYCFILYFFLLELKLLGLKCIVESDLVSLLPLHCSVGPRLLLSEPTIYISSSVESVLSSFLFPRTVSPR